MLNLGDTDRSTVSNMGELPQPLEFYLRLMSDPAGAPGLDAAVHEQVGNLLAGLRDPSLAVAGVAHTSEEFRRRVEAYEASTLPLAPLFAHGSRWGRPEHARTWTIAFERLATLPDESGNKVLLDLRSYPAVILFHAAAIGAVMAADYRLLAHVMLEGRLADYGRDVVLTERFIAARALERDAARALPELDKHKTPASDRLHEMLQPVLMSVTSDDRHFDEAFDQAEVVLAICALHDDRWPGTGRYMWKADHGVGPRRRLAGDLARLGARHPLLIAGLLGGSADRMNELLARLDQVVARSGLAW